MSFSPSNYLRGLGWQGPGKGLTDAPHARSKPVIIAQKKTLSGVGKDRDQAFPWWEMVFATVASKGAAEKTELHRTSTGIISNKPAPQPSAYASGDAPTIASTSALNLDALGLAKLEAARRQLYSSFLRGKAIDPTVKEEEEAKEKAKGKKRKVEDVEVEDAEVEGEEKEKKKLSKEERRLKKEAKRLRRESKSATTSTCPSDIDSDSFILLPTPIESPSLSPPPASKKLKKSKSTPSSLPYLSPEESIAAEELAYKESREAAKRALKEEKRLQKVVKKALKEKKDDGKE